MTTASGAWLTGPGMHPRDCPCQYGTNPFCGLGHHSECTGGRPDTPLPETFLLDKRGLVVTSPDAPDGIDVWLADRACRYVCNCPCHQTVQLSLFDP